MHTVRYCILTSQQARHHPALNRWTTKYVTGARAVCQTQTKNNMENTCPIWSNELVSECRILEVHHVRPKTLKQAPGRGNITGVFSSPLVPASSIAAMICWVQFTHLVPISATKVQRLGYLSANDSTRLEWVPFAPHWGHNRHRCG